MRWGEVRWGLFIWFHPSCVTPADRRMWFCSPTQTDYIRNYYYHYYLNAPPPPLSNKHVIQVKAVITVRALRWLFLEHPNNLILGPKSGLTLDVSRWFNLEIKGGGAHGCLSFETEMWSDQISYSQTIWSHGIIIGFYLIRFYIKQQAFHSPISQFLPVKPDGHVQV